MNNAEQTLVTLLTTSPLLQPKLGNRVSPDRADPLTPTPFVALTRSATEAMQSLACGIENPDVTMDVHVWGASRAQANDVTDTLIEVVQAQGIYVRSRESGYSDDLQLHGCMLAVVLE